MSVGGVADPVVARAVRAFVEETDLLPLADTDRTRRQIVAGLRAGAIRRRRLSSLALVVAAAGLGGSAALAMVKTPLARLWRGPIIERLESPARAPARPRRAAAPGTRRTPATPAWPPLEQGPPGPAPALVSTPVPAPAAAPAPPPPPPRPHAIAPRAATPPPSAAGTARSAELTLYEIAHRLHFRERDPVRALAAWDHYLQVAPSGTLVLEARYNRALCLYRLGQMTEAAAALAPFASGHVGDGYRQAEARALLGAAVGGGR
jgi:hypothetical protein